MSIPKIVFTTNITQQRLDLSFSCISILKPMLHLLWNHIIIPRKHMTENCNPNSNDADNVLSFLRMIHMNPTPSIYEFNKTLADTLKSNRDYRKVISLYNQMEVGGVKPDIMSMNILINYFSNLHQMKLASSIFGRILKIDYELTVVTLNTMLRGFCINNEVGNALRFSLHWMNIFNLI